MTGFSKTTINCLKTAEAGGGTIYKFSSQPGYWGPKGFSRVRGEAYPDRKKTFGSMTVNALIKAGLLYRSDGYPTDQAVLTDAGRAVLAKLKEQANA